MPLGFATAIGPGLLFGLLVGEAAFGEQAVMRYLIAVNTMPKVPFALPFVS